MEQKASRIWALDTTRPKSIELLAAADKPYQVAGMSPDSRYVFLIERLGKAKGDLTAVPYLWDRTTGRIAEGAPTSIRFARWSGYGFYVDWMAHLDLALQATRFDQLAQPMRLKAGEREVFAASFSADGMNFAALVGHPSGSAPLDLVWGETEGEDHVIAPGAVTGTGGAVDVALSPDGEYVAITGTNGAGIARTADLVSDQWTRVPAGRFGITWAPDSKHLWIPEAGVFNLSGKRVFQPERVHGLVWHPAGGSGVVYGWSSTAPFLQAFGVNGTSRALEIPEYVIPAGFLSDGRLLVWRAISE